MPAKFRLFSYENKETFRCKLKCQRCKSKSKSTGKRCTRNTCMATPYCWQHTRTNLHVRVLKSKFLESLGINGLGLYAWDKSKQDRKKPIFSNGDIIGPVDGDGTMYGGQHIGKRELDRRYDFEACGRKITHTTAPYGLTSSDGKTYDAACRRGIGAYANSVRGRQKVGKWIDGKRSRSTFCSNNTKFEGLNLVVTKRIYHGDEIFVTYHSAYWRGLTFSCNGVRLPTNHHITHPLKVSGEKSLHIGPYKSSLH